MKASSGAEPSGRCQWQLFGHIVCHRAFCSLLGVSKKRVDRLSAAAKAGRLTVPDDGRKHNRSECGPCLPVDAFFFYMYEYVAEPLAEGGDDSGGEADGADADSDAQSSSDGEELSVVDSVVSRLVVGCGNKSPVKWMGHCTRAELYDQYHTWHVVNNKAGNPASMSTFRRVHKGPWHKILKIRNLGQHARCAKCAEFAEMRRHAETEGEKASVQSMIDQHHQTIFADRAVDNRAARLSEESCRIGTLPGRVLKLDIDGMDQAKFRIPRNLCQSKQFDSLWRPQCHVVGVVCHGLLEAFYLMDADIPKNASCQRTMLSRTLDLCAAELAARNLSMPEHLLFHVPWPAIPTCSRSSMREERQDPSTARQAQDVS